MNFNEIKAPQKVGDRKASDSDIIANKLDFSTYKHNNWILPNKEDNQTINKINSQNGAIWLNCKGEICYRFNTDGTITTQPHNKANIVFTNYLNRNIKLVNGTKEHPEDIRANDLILVDSDTFNPYRLEEFFKENNLYYRNKFKPSQYLQLKDGEYREPIYILKLIKHLVNGNDEYYNYFVNWLAYFFQGLKKSQVSIVLRGNQGAGKGILFDEVIKKIFGEDYCIQVNDKALGTSYIGGIVESRLFFNLDEISHNVAGNKNVKNFLKALVTNDSITAEKKFLNMENETKLYGQVLITSNEPYIIEVETSDRRFSIFSTGDNLQKCNYLGCGTYSNLSQNIRSELKDFSLFLKSYKVDNVWANTALDTPEKRALVNSTNDKFKLFANAIKNKDEIFFSELEEDKSYLYNILVDDFKKDRIQKEKLKEYFSELFGEEISPKSLNNRLRAIDPLLFDDSNAQKSNGKRYYKL